MNKLMVVMIAIIVVIGAMFTAVMIFSPKEEKTQNSNITQVAKEEIFDDCTDEYVEMEHENTIKANTQEEKTSPNCSMITKTYYSKCGHTKEEYTNLPGDMVNLRKEEIEEKYPEYKVDSFSSNEVVLSQEKEASCQEHYKVKDKDGQLIIYQILEDGTTKELEITGITTEYLPETDKINMEKGIEIVGKQNLNQLIEDYE